MYEAHLKNKEIVKMEFCALSLVILIATIIFKSLPVSEKCSARSELDAIFNTYVIYIT